MAAMFAGGSYEIANFRGQNKDLELGVFASPGLAADDEKLVAIYFDGGYAANAKTPHKDAALKFLNYVASQEFGQAFANSLKEHLHRSGRHLQDPLLAEVAELNQHAIPYLMLVHFRYGEPSGSVLLQGEMQKLLDNKTTPADVGKAVTDGLANWYAPFKK